MASKDIDALDLERVRNLVKGWKNVEVINFEELFRSERVIETLSIEKLLLNGFKPDKIKAVLPFTPVVYTPICRTCVKKENYEEFKLFVKSGVVVPVLTNFYKYYDDGLRDFLLAHHHISSQEFHAYRYFHAVSKGSRPMCAHCIRAQVEKVCKGLGNDRDSKLQKMEFEYLIRNLQPYPQSDEPLIELAIQTFEGGKREKLEQLRQMTRIIEEVRLGETFRSPVLLEEKDLTSLPSRSSIVVDEGLSKAAALKKMISNGLSISIPTEIPTEQFIELVKDYQPRISKTIERVLATGSAEASILDVSKNIMEINRELERIRGLRRYAVLDASIAFFRNNKLLAAAMMLAGSLGFIGSIAGCVATGGAALGMGWAKKRGLLEGLLKESEQARRLRQIIARDLQPAADLFLQTYLGARAPAINVLSLQKRMEAAKHEARGEKREARRKKTVKAT